MDAVLGLSAWSSAIPTVAIPSLPNLLKVSSPQFPHLSKHTALSPTSEEKEVPSDKSHLTAATHLHISLPLHPHFPILSCHSGRRVPPSTLSKSLCLYLEPSSLCYAELHSIICPRARTQITVGSIGDTKQENLEERSGSKRYIGLKDVPGRQSKSQDQYQVFRDKLKQR